MPRLTMKTRPQPLRPPAAHAVLAALAAMVALVGAAAPMTASAQQDTYSYRDPSDPSYGPNRARLAVFGGVHLGGRARQSSGGTGISQDLGPAPTVGLRVELPIGPFFVVGGFGDFVSIQADRAPVGANRLSLLGLGVWLKFRGVLALGASLLELYVGVPLGISVWVPTDAGVDPEQGAVMGLLGGAQAHLSDSVALFAECGFRLDYFNLRGTGTTYLQGAVRVGVSFGF